MSLDRLELTALSTILGEIITDKKTGRLTVLDHGNRKMLFWSLGELVMVGSDAPEDSLADLLVRRGMLAPEGGQALAETSPQDLVLRFHDLELTNAGSRQSLLREWVSGVVIPLFSLDTGTAAFTPEDALDPEQRIFLSTPAVVLDGVRDITNGLVLRRSLGDIKREVGQAGEPRYSLDRLPLLENERKIAESLEHPKTVEAFLREFAGDSLTSARVVIAMLTLGIYVPVENRPQNANSGEDEEQMNKDLQLLAMLGSGDPRSLQAVALARQSAKMDFYQVLDVPRAAMRGQIVARGDEMKKQYDVGAYPAMIREYIEIIRRKIDEAIHILAEPNRRQEYDKMVAASRRDESVSVQQRLTRRSIAEQNFRRARELSISGDYWGAIVLLRQAVEFAPDHAEAWYILGTCLEQNPKWRREAVEAYQRSLSINPNYVEAMISLGDLYKTQAMVSRAISSYEDALQIEPENSTAKSRLKALGKARK